MVTPVEVFGSPSVCDVSKILACLIEKDVQFKLIPMEASKRTSPDFLKIQPFGQVPAIRDESTSVFGSRSICRYICEKHADKGNKGLYGTNPLVKASIDKWVEVETQWFDPPSLILIEAAMHKTDPKVIKQNEENLKKVLEVYEKRLRESRYLASNEFTLADLFHLPTAHNLNTAGKWAGMITSKKNVAKWWNNISNRDSWKKVLEIQKTENEKNF